MTTEALKRTPLYTAQAETGAKFVDFHGWDLPVQFTSIMKEHAAVRSAAGLFDVSHMGQVFVEGPEALDFLQRVQCNDLSKLKPGRAMYTHILNERGGVVDDVIISRLAVERWFIVVNAGTREKDVAWLRQQAGALNIIDRSDAYGMIALQGPRAEEIIKSIAPEASALKRFGAIELEIFGQPHIITRTGYTGEDGFEIVAPAEICSRIWRTLLSNGASLGLQPCGLGARDTLRLEAGYLLYGSDVDDERSPYAAGYGWVVKMAKGDFIGKAELQREQERGLSQRLRGVQLKDRGVPRPGAPVLIGGEKVGTLCSATYSPTLKTGIGMGYLPEPLPAGDVAIELHGRPVAAEIVKPPFYKK
jgi:aminomethyltransferase